VCDAGEAPSQGAHLDFTAATPRVDHQRRHDHGISSLATGAGVLEPRTVPVYCSIALAAAVQLDLKIVPERKVAFPPGIAIHAA
jgi:hypothetical protein